MRFIDILLIVTGSLRPVLFKQEDNLLLTRCKYHYNEFMKAKCSRLSYKCAMCHQLHSEALEAPETNLSSCALCWLFESYSLILLFQACGCSYLGLRPLCFGAVGAAVLLLAWPWLFPWIWAAWLLFTWGPAARVENRKTVGTLVSPIKSVFGLEML